MPSIFATSITVYVSAPGFDTLMASSRSKELPTPVCCHRLGAFMIEGCRCRFSPELVRAVMGGPWRAAPFTLNTPACVRGLEPREMYLSRTTPENHSTRQARMPCRTIDSTRHEPQKRGTHVYRTQVHNGCGYRHLPNLHRVMQVIRTLECKGEAAVTISMSPPVQDGSEWVCNWKIDGLDVPADSLRCVGSDPMEAMIFALATIGSTIKASPDAKHLTFLHHPALRMLELDNSDPSRLKVGGEFPTATS